MVSVRSQRVEPVETPVRRLISTSSIRRAGPIRGRRSIRGLGAIAGLVVLSLFVGAAPAHADSIRDREYWLDAYSIRQAWNTTTGAGVTIAVIDTGVDGSHIDLAGAVVGGTDFSGSGAANGQKPVGANSPNHGTMVASLAAGRGHGSGAGIIGAAPGASILAISVGFADADSDQQLADAVRWAVDNGADVINMSLTRNTLDWPESWDDAFLYAAENDVVVVAAAGNRGSGTAVVGAPATMPGVLTVAGLDRNGSASWDASSQGITIGVSAPSEQLVGAVPGDGYVLWDGTSGATPLVAGVAALVRAAHPDLDAANVINRIVATAKPAGDPGPDPLYGYGILDAKEAVTASVPVVDANPLGDLADWVTLHRRGDAPAMTPLGGFTPPAIATPVAPDDGVTGVLLPSIPQLRDVGVPLALFAGFLIAFGVLVVSFVRWVRRARNPE